MSNFLEISRRTMDTMLSLKILHQRLSAEDIPPLPPAKIFKPKHNLPILENYRKPAPQDFWTSFPSNHVQPSKSMVDPHLLKKLALETGFADIALLDKIHSDLLHGANLGCSGPSRLPSFSTNAPSAYEYAQHVSDAIADWTTKKFAYGPVPLTHIPAGAKINGMMTKLKPTGAVRIILNLSSPVGNCVNEGINKDDFPTIMSSTTKWLRALHISGKKAKMCKIDWADAYKHIAVRAEDTDLQWFTWLGMAFKELCLIFGCTSSAGIFDRVAKLVVHIAATRSKFPINRICQHLDDCCATSPANSDTLELFDATFADVATTLGIKLAPRDDPEKSFGPSTKGLVLGIVYDTVTWTWSLNYEKLSRLLHHLKELLIANEIAQVQIWSIVGKIIHILPLIPLGKFNIHHLLDLNSVSLDKNFQVSLTPGFKKQIFFWFSMLRICSGRGKIINPDKTLPPWAINVYTDAAGGSMESVGLGLGAVTEGWWAYVPWSRAINLNTKSTKGRSIGRAMSALELVGPLLVVSGGYSWTKNHPINIWVDNAASVFIWEKGYSRSCPLSNTLVTAIAQVAAGLGCEVKLSKISRCSTPLASMADALSKCSFNKFWNLANKYNISLPIEPSWTPPSLLAWINNPIADDCLGDKILHDLSRRTLVLGINC